MKIQLKRSSVLDGGAAKQPTPEQMEYGELAVNYNVTDPSIFIKGSDNAIIKIAGEGAAGGDQTLQEVCSNGSTTTTVLDVNRPDDQGQAFTAKAGGILKYVVGSDGGVAIATDSNGLNPQIALKADGTASFTGNTDIGGNVAIATDKILLNADGTSTFTGGSTFEGTINTTNNIITSSGYFRSNQATSSDSALEARLNDTITFKVLAGGGVAIGGTIDESADQSTANIFLKNDGTAKITGVATIATYDLASLLALPEVS